MGDAIGQVLAFAVVVGLSPIPIIGVVLMLGTPRARTNGPAFVLGWVAGLSVVGAVVLIASGGADATDDGGPAGWVSAVQLLLGLLLLLVAAKYWRGRPRGGAQPEMPAWMERLDTFTPIRAASLGVLLSAVNPKNLVLVVAAAAAIAQTGASAGAQAVALAVFVVIGTLGTGVPVALYLALGDRSRETLDDVREWMGRNNAVIMVVLCLVIGAKLIGDAISGLSG